jgi:bacterial/archaeal transporter family-2 protein
MMSLMILAGASLALQVAWNARMRAAVEAPVVSALVSLLVSLLVVSAVIASGVFGRGRLTNLGAAPWWAWCGGFCGAYYLVISLVALPRIGSAVLIGCAVFGQLTAAMLLDTMGWFDVPRTPLTFSRVAGAILLLAGVLLVQRR